MARGQQTLDERDAQASNISSAIHHWEQDWEH
jgi:hypothetical protein